MAIQKNILESKRNFKGEFSWYQIEKDVNAREAGMMRIWKYLMKKSCFFMHKINFEKMMNHSKSKNL
jgi:hypothetical protein